MISATIGLGLILVGLFFGNLAMDLVGLLCLIAGLYPAKSKPVREAPKTKEKKTRHMVISSEPPRADIMPWEIPNFPVSAVAPKDTENKLDDAIKQLKSEGKKAKTEKDKKEISDMINEAEREKEEVKKGYGGLNFLPLPDYGYSDPIEKIFFGLPIKFLKKAD